MTARQTRDTAAPASTYVWDQHPDDPTLGGAITADMFDALQASALQASATPRDAADTPPPADDA